MNKEEEKEEEELYYSPTKLLVILIIIIGLDWIGLELSWVESYCYILIVVKGFFKKKSI